MTRPDDEDFSPIDLDDDLVRQAILQTQGREYTDEEIEELALEAAEQSEEFKELEARQAQGLWNYPFEGADVFLAVDEYGDEIIPTDLDVIKYLCRNIVRRELSFFEIDKLDKPITRSELAIVVYTKVRAFFPNYEIGREKLKTLLDALTNNPIAEPGMTIPVWNGRTVSKPGNETPLLFDNGLFTVNEWRKPAFRNLSHAEPDIACLMNFYPSSLKAKKKKFAWGGKGPAYAYYHPEAQPERGMLNTGNYRQTIESHINERLKIAMDEIGFGITHEQPHRKAKEASDDVPF